MTLRFVTAAALTATLFIAGCNAEKPETPATLPTSIATTSETGFTAPDEAWRTVDPENMIVIDTKYGDIAIELYPEIAPNHVAQIKALARSGFYDNVPFHRVIDGFMNQTGDGSNGDGTGDSDLPNIDAEFTFRRGADMPFTLITAEQVGEGEIGIGFYKALPIASQSTAQASLTEDNKVNAFGLHCKGVTSMARTSDPNSANSQFFLMRAQAEHLDTQYTIWGNTVMGYEHLDKPIVGTIGQIPDWVPDRMNEVEVAADMEEDERPVVQVLKTDSPAFNNWLKSQKNEDGTYPNICNLPVPTRVL